MIYFTSDLHISHNNIIKYCNRPFADVHTMNKALTENWNAVVTPDDDIYQLGDFAFGNDPVKYMKLLNGNIISIRGNHDKDKSCKQWIQRMEFEYGGYKFLLNHRPVYIPGTNDPFRDAEQHANINLDDYSYIVRAYPRKMES